MNKFAASKSVRRLCGDRSPVAPFRRGRATAPSHRRLSLEPLEHRTLLTAYVVDTPLDDPLAGGDVKDGLVSLREAIVAANTNLPFGDAPEGQGGEVADSITFDESLNGQPIVLGGLELTVGDDLSITGPGADKLMISGNGAGGVFSIDWGVSVQISGVAIGDGNASCGGGIYNEGVLALANCIFTRNYASDDGGGIWNDGLLSIVDSIFLENESWNTAGAIWNSGILEIANSTISGNKSNGEGGGIWNFGALHITNSTIVGNRADADGNGSGTGGGLYNLSSDSILNNTILVGNQRGKGRTHCPDEISGIVDAASAHNLIGDASTAGGLVHELNGNIVGNAGVGTIDPDTVLDPDLADNGGPTLTHALVPGGPAVNAGDNEIAVDADGNPLVNDQRGTGFTRIVDGAVDIGALEVQTQAPCVQIDVKPASDLSSIDLASGGLSAPAILTIDGFNALRANARRAALAASMAVDRAVEGFDDLDLFLSVNGLRESLEDLVTAGVI